MIELYHSTHSTCSQKVRLCLAEKGLAWTGHHLNLRRFDQLKPEFLALNPAGLVPVLVDGGQVFTESRIINEYLEDAYPQPRLSPEGAYARARMRLWTKNADEVATETVKLPSFVKNIQPELQRMPRVKAALRYAPCAFRAHPSCATISMVDPSCSATRGYQRRMVDQLA